MDLNTQSKKEILDYLGKHKLMSVGTYYRLPWAASVYYLYDDNFNFYFVSSPNRVHCQNIEKNSKVSITIANSQQDPKGKKVGFQARGVAKKVSSVSELKEIIKSWNKRGFVPVTYAVFKKAWKSRFYRIKVTDLQIFDENQSKELEKRIWKV